jgi:hypothetical protein
MPIEAEHILSVLDRCCDAFTFPMLDNGYVYLAATRLSLYRTASDWAMVIEVFGYSPRAWLPDTHIYTFASTLCNRGLVRKRFAEHLGRHRPFHGSGHQRIHDAVQPTRDDPGAVYP